MYIYVYKRNSTNTMKIKFSIIMLLMVTLIACQKEEEPASINQIPPGSTPFTDDDILFVAYTSESPSFKDQNDNILTLNFKERLRTEEYYAWDQTYFTFSTDTTLELEMRLRYLQSDVSKKTLAMYMPYYDSFGVLRTNLFEMPIDNTGIEEGFFENIIDFHDTLMVGSTERYNVYEVTELVTTNSDQDGPLNFARVFYNRVQGILIMHQRDGVIWTLQ
jgi:hypothetical protein